MDAYELSVFKEHRGIGKKIDAIPAGDEYDGKTGIGVWIDDASGETFVAISWDPEIQAYGNLGVALSEEQADRLIFALLQDRSALRDIGSAT